jgi:TorA maturation chaperone TorD
MSGMANQPWLDPQTRQQVYHFLAAAYLRPLTSEALRHLADPGVLQELAALVGEDAIADLKDFWASAGARVDEEELRQEYMDLFAVPAGRYVTPFEDVYRGASADRKLGPLLGEHAVAVSRLYRVAGADLDERCTELPTHVGVELAFMSFLCAREAEAEAALGRAIGSPSNGDEGGRARSAYYQALQRRFLQDHLNAWFSQLSCAIRERAKSGLYRGIAALTQAVLRKDAAWLTTQPSPAVATAAVH